MTLYSQNLIFSNYPIIQLEGQNISTIAFYYPRDKLAKLKEVLQNHGFLPLKKGDTASKPYQLLFDSLVDGSLFRNQSAVNELKEGIRDCPRGLGQVNVSSFCSKNCYERSRKEWIECHRCADKGIPYSMASSSGKPFKGAVR